MSLKLLILPTFIILSLVIAIGYIKPEVDTILSRRDEIVAQKEALTRVDAVAQNIRSLDQALDARRETENFVLKYFPRSLDEERVVDMLNYLAQQSGVIVTEIIVTENPLVRPDVAAMASADGGTDPAALDPASVAAFEASLPRTYTAKATVFGAYPNLKDFFSRVYRTDRLHATRQFVVTYREKEDANTEEDALLGIQENFLLGTLETDFAYKTEKRAGIALTNPLFQTSSFNFSAADRLIDFVTSPLPPLEADPAGKSSPFE
jgi:hypothetical protein